MVVHQSAVAEYWLDDVATLDCPLDCQKVASCMQNLGARKASMNKAN